MFLSIIYGYFHISSNFLQRNNIMINLIQRRKNGNKPIHLRSILINNCKNNKNGANKKISMQKIMLCMYYNLTGHYFLQKEHIQKLYMNEQPVKLSLYLLTTGDHSQGSTYRATQYVTRWQIEDALSKRGVSGNESESLTMYYSG